MWYKILETNWNFRFGPRNADEHIDGTKATEGRMRGINEVIRRFLSVVEVSVFGAAVLAILVIGELNFSTAEMRYQTEPLASIGTFLALLARSDTGASFEAILMLARPMGTNCWYCACHDRLSVFALGSKFRHFGNRVPVDHFTTTWRLFALHERTAIHTQYAWSCL